MAFQSSPPPSPALRESEQDLPLEGVRVLAVEQYGAGPFGSMHLADLGAEVIKIEPPGGGDVSRATGPHFLGENDSHFFQTFNRNKKSVVLDLKSEAGRADFHRLVVSADVLLENLRGDQAGKLGLTHTALAPHNPKIVCGHLSAYGRDNERAAWPGYDYLMQAECGWMDLTGEPDGPPSRAGLSLVDYMSGVTLATGLLAALVGAMKTGRGRDVDVSLFDVALFQLSYPAAWYLNGRHETTRQPRSAHPATVPCQLFDTADGRIFLMCMTPKFWDVLVEEIGDAALREPRFASIALRREHKAALIERLDAAFRRRSTQAWLAALGGKLPIAPVHGLAQALDNPFAAGQGLLQTTPHPAAPGFRLVASPIRLDGQRLPARACSALGSDTAAVVSVLTNS
jgi:crotonobetainyl-CoA:carnitine CoA-transferase CaiB-like acyl-CoA transferase